MAIIKPEALKSYLWLECADGSIQQVEEEVAMFCPMICREVCQNSSGSSKNNAIVLPERVHPSSLSLILDYCRFHQVPGRSNKERKSFDERFIKMDIDKLSELTSAANSLQLKPLVDLTSKALARMIEGKSPEEIREIFNLPDDLTEEEKLEPLKNIYDDPRIRLLNRLNAKKLKELKERQKAKDIDIKEEPKDERSIDEILCFINGDGGCKDVKSCKNKRKNKKKKDHLKELAGSDSNSVQNKEATACNTDSRGRSIVSPTASQSSEVLDDTKSPFASRMEFDDDLDDELDPALREEIDREVEDFARRLNSEWPERMQELYSCGQERRNVPNAVSCSPATSSLSGHD